MHRFTPAAFAVVCLVSFCLLLPCANAAVYTWDGSGAPNNGGNWSDPLNWHPDSGYPSNAADTAVLPVPGVARYVTNDVATTIDTLIMGDSTSSHLVLGADMKSRYFDGDPNGAQAKLNLNGYTFTVERGNTLYFATLDGAGTLVKTGTDTVTLQSEDTFTGTIIVSNGLLYIRSGHWDTATKLTVADGGTAKRQAQYQAPNETRLFPPHIEINGFGYGSDGALSPDWLNMVTTSRITVATDARITIPTGSALIFTLEGDIDGNGALTLQPRNGEIRISASSITYSNKFIVTNGTVVIYGDLPNITNIWVDAGGVMEGLQSQFPKATVVETNGGVWIQANSATWTGNGDGSNWTDTANWSPQIVPTNTATINAPASPRIIVVDTNLVLTKLALENNANNDLRLAGNMTVNRVEAGSTPSLYMEGYTLTVNESSASYIFRLDGGGGLFRKTGPGKCYPPGASAGYNGNYEITDGLFQVWGGNMGAGGSANMLIADGAIVQIQNPSPEPVAFPSNVVINGNGTGAGALRNGYTHFDFYPDITVATDAEIQNAVVHVFTMHGDITGPGNLTFSGDSATRTNVLDGTYNFAVGKASANSIIVESGVVDISGATLSVTMEGIPAEKEYVVVDYSGAGTLLGEFAEILGLKSGSQIVYTGTDDNPDCVVLIAGAKGSLLLVR